MTVQRVLRTLSIVAVAAMVTACSSPDKKKAQYLQAGDALVAQNKHAEAIIEYKNALQQDEHFGEARFKLAKSYEQQKDYGKALKEYVRAADLMPDNHDAQLAAARLLVMAGRFEDGKTRAEKVIAADPKSVQANLVLGSALVGLKDVDGAIKQVEDAVALDPLDGQSQTTLGVLSLAKGDIARAEASFAEAVRVKPDSIEARISLASFFWMQKRTVEAEAGLKAALAIDPSNELVNRALAAFYMQSDRRAEAEPFLKTIAEKGNASTKLALADYYTGMKRIEDAKTTLKSVEADKKIGGQASVRLALILFAEKRSAEAYAIVDGLIAKGTEIASAQLMKGRFLLADQKLEPAIDALRAAIKADPKLASAHFMLGNALSANNDLAGAADAYRATLELVPGAATVQLQLARVSLQRGDSATSFTAATTALEKQPDNPVARVVMAEALIAKGDYSRAAESIAKLKSDFPKAPSVYILEGKLMGFERKHAEAARAFSYALTLEPRALDAVVGLVGVDLATGNTASAVKRAETLLQAKPGDPAMRLLASRAYFANKQPQKTEELLKGLLQDNAANPTALSLLADLYMKQGRLPEALERFQALAVLEPKSVPAHTMMGMIHQSQKRNAEAKKSYESALEASPNAAIAANNLAWILADERQDLERALMLANQASALRPEDPQVFDTLGWVYMQKQLPALALPSFEKAVAKEPGNAEFQYHLGMAYAAAGEKVKARTHLQKALAISGTFTGAAEARGLLSGLGS